MGCVKGRTALSSPHGMLSGRCFQWRRVVPFLSHSSCDDLCDLVWPILQVTCNLWGVPIYLIQRDSPGTAIRERNLLPEAPIKSLRRCSQKAALLRGTYSLPHQAIGPIKPLHRFTPGDLQTLTPCESVLDLHIFFFLFFKKSVIYWSLLPFFIC